MKRTVWVASQLVLFILLMLCLAACKKADGHNHLYSDSWSYDETNHWHSAVCSRDNECRFALIDSAAHTITNGVCEICGYTAATDGGEDGRPEGGDPGDNTGSEPTDPDKGDDTDTGDTTCAEHSYTAETVTEAGCLTDGEKKYTCSICGDTYTEAIGAVGHSLQTLEGYDPTCTEYGMSSGKQCTACGEITVEQVDLNPTGHSYVDGVCHCGAERPPEITLRDDEILGITTSAYCWIDKVSFTAENTGKYTFYLPSGLGAVDADNAASARPYVDSLHPNYIPKEYSFDILLEKGQSYEFYIAAETVDSWVIRFSYTECEIAPEIPDDPDAPEWWEDPTLDLSGVYYGSDAFGNQMLTVVINSANGSVIFSYEHPLTGPNVVNATYEISEGDILLFNQDGAALHPLAGTLTVEDGVPTYASFDGTQYMLSTQPPAGSEGSSGLDNVVLKGVMVDEQENIFRITAQDMAEDKFYVSFMPYNTGAYDFISKHIFVANAYTKSGEKVERNEYDYFLFTVYEQYTLEITSEFVGHVDDFSITPAYKHPAGHEKNPAWYTLGETVTAEYLGNSEPVWYQFYADKTGVLTVSGIGGQEGVTFMVGAFIGYDISGEGSVSLPVVQGRKYYIGVVAYDSGAMSIQFEASVTEGEITSDGSINVPHEVVDGDNSLELDAYTGYYLIYKAPASGTLTLSTDSGNVGWCFADLSQEISLAYGDISIHLDMSDVVYIYVENMLDSASAFDFTASFKNDPKVTWVNGPFVTDGSAPNIFTVEDDRYIQFQITGQVGNFTISWDNPDAVVLVDNVAIQNGSTLTVNSAWFGPYVSVYIDGYVAGEVALTITPKA